MIEYGERGVLIYCDAVSAYPEEPWVEDQTESIEPQRKANRLEKRLIGKWRKTKSYEKHS